MTPALDPSACLASAWQIAPDLPLRLVVVSGLMGLAGWGGAQRFFPGKWAFVWLAVVLAAWIAGTTVEHAAVEATCKTTIALMSWPLVMVQPPLWAMFLYQYVRSETSGPPRRLWVPMVAVMALLMLVVLTNGRHGLFYGEGTHMGPPILGLPRMHYAYGPLFYVGAAWGYGWLLTAMVIIVRAIRDGAMEDRRQWITFLVMMMVPWAANFAYIGFGVRLLGGDPTPLSFAVAVVGFGWLIRSSALLKVVPLSHRLLFQALPDPVLVLDAWGRVVDCNAAGRRLAGTAMPLGRPLAEWPVFGARLVDLLGRDGFSEGTLVLDAPSVVMDVKSRDIGVGERRIGRLLQLRDVTDRHRAQTHLAGALAERDERLQQVAQLEAELREQTLRDPLTGLLNRRALAQRFALERQHQQATGHALTLVLLDIDHFKHINDTYGHAAGDDVLTALGQTFTLGLRGSDTVCRFGGEEFALLLPNADGPQALHRVQALREDTALRHRLPDGRPVTFSAGICTCCDGQTSLDELLRQADAALYAAKAAGRDRTVLSAPGAA